MTRELSEKEILTEMHEAVGLKQLHRSTLALTYQIYCLTIVRELLLSRGLTQDDLKTYYLFLKAYTKESKHYRSKTEIERDIRCEAETMKNRSGEKKIFLDTGHGRLRSRIDKLIETELLWRQDATLDVKQRPTFTKNHPIDKRKKKVITYQPSTLLMSPELYTFSMEHLPEPVPVDANMMIKVLDTFIVGKYDILRDEEFMRHQKYSRKLSTGELKKENIVLLANLGLPPDVLRYLHTEEEMQQHFSNTKTLRLEKTFHKQLMELHK